MTRNTAPAENEDFFMKPAEFLWECPATPAAYF
jgi:hypothetical protein